MNVNLLTKNATSQESYKCFLKTARQPIGIFVKSNFTLLHNFLEVLQ